jgi:hypothetical protein
LPIWPAPTTANFTVLSSGINILGYKNKPQN